MRLLELSMESVGPFDSAHLRLLDGPDDPRRVALITGENGTGKTVVLDAVRAVFGEEFAEIERDLRRRDRPLQIVADFLADGSRGPVEVRIAPGGEWRWPEQEDHWLSLRSKRAREGRVPLPPWVVDYWRSGLPQDDGRIDTIRRSNHRDALRRALQGQIHNADVTQELCFVDYLRDSRNPHERSSGEALWAVAERIVAVSLLEGGRLAEIERSTFTPMVEQAGYRVPLQNLSSGNAYLIGRMMTLLGRMYSVTVVRDMDPAEAPLLPGLLLIDEAENHLHPKWQKRLLPAVLDVFPNLQIVATTHSPFVLASMPEARVFVCRYDADRRTCVVDEADRPYANMPIDEILASPAFDGTPPFGTEITALLRERDEAIAAGDGLRRRAAEDRLRELNPTYFGYLDLDERIAASGRGVG